MAKWIEKMASETVETKLPRLCHARLSQLSKQTVGAPSNYKLSSIGRSTPVARSRVITRSTGSAFRVSRFPENLFVLRIRWTIFEERETRWLASRVGSVTLSPIVFTRR